MAFSRPGIPVDTPGSAERKILTVSQLTREIKACIEGRFGQVWVEGEISGLKLHHSGHIYFSLKDENAVLKAAFFSRHNQGLKFQLADGLKVICAGKISLYEPRGDYQLYVERIEPQGLGALQLAFEQLKARLAQEGLFDSGRKRAIPPYPRKVGIVTSPTGAALRDILNIVNRRFAGIHILIYPVRVQGPGACDEIARGIEDLNTFQDIDVLIVGRGGGSLEDLWAFNEETVARAIFRSRIPVISAVGHEVDWTIADFVADLRAPTPSAAAELVSKSREELENRLKNLSERARNGMRNLYAAKREELENLTGSYAFKQPLFLVEQWSQRLDELLRQLCNYVKNIRAQKENVFKHVAGKLEALSPLAILARGYSLTFDGEGKLIKNAAAVKRGDRLVTRLSQGSLESEVISKKEEKGK
ncbi:MAG: exodeoxyribonuclease VII large subunit [Candidatus Omnitrophica bacterium]|nr:exodeoxyribonuclease VII large subunit [Candidatus Omnitrophota bacterium]